MPCHLLVSSVLRIMVLTKQRSFETILDLRQNRLWTASYSQLSNNSWICRLRTPNLGFVDTSQNVLGWNRLLAKFKLWVIFSSTPEHILSPYIFVRRYWCFCHNSKQMNIFKLAVKFFYEVLMNLFDEFVWRYFFTNFFTNFFDAFFDEFLTKFLLKFLMKFFDEIFDAFFYELFNEFFDEFFWRIYQRIFWRIVWRIFWQIFDL